MFLDDVDYLVEDFVVIPTIISMCSSAYHVIVAFHRIDAPSTWLLMHLHHTGSQEESQVAVPEEQVWTDKQEPQAQVVPEEEEQGEELPECVDHQPSSFERGKPRSILSLLLYKSNSLLYELYIYCCIKL
jgi:hypothetical protein